MPRADPISEPNNYTDNWNLKKEGGTNNNRGKN